MAQQALHNAQARLDQLQKQRDAAFRAWRANPTSELEKECYEDLKISLHKAEDAVNSLAAAASTSGSPDMVIKLFQDIVSGQEVTRKQLTRVEQGNAAMFYHMFAPSISDMTQRSREIQQNCVKAYNAEQRAPKILWCMVLGQYLDTQLIKAAHIYKPSWPASIAAQLQLDVDSPANSVSMQKHIEHALDRFQLIVIPQSGSVYKIHILDPQLGPKMVHAEVKDCQIKFQDLDGTVLQFATAARPAKRAFAWHAEMAVRFGSDKQWSAATTLAVPPFAWSSETCDSEIRERFFGDLMGLSSAATTLDADLEALSLSL